MFSKSNYLTLRSGASKKLYPENTLYDFTNQLCTTIDFTRKSSVAVAEVILPLNFKKITKPDQSGLNTFIMFTDIVDDSIIGDARLNMLRVVSCDRMKSSKNAQVFSYPKLFYFPLTIKSVNNIRIRFEDNLGNVILSPKTDPDLKPYDETFVVLHFK
jgi:hypothetical protein